MSIENNVIMGRRPGISNTERLFRAEIARKLLAQIGAKRGARTKAAATLGVCKQAMSLYLNEKATPGSEVLRRACLLWNLSFEVEGTVVNSSSFRQLAGSCPNVLRHSVDRFREKKSPRRMITAWALLFLADLLNRYPFSSSCNLFSVRCRSLSARRCSSIFAIECITVV